MTICTERKLLERLNKAAERYCPEGTKDEREEARAFLADTPACDAEKAVLVAALDEIRVDSVRWSTPECGLCRWCGMPVTPKLAGHTERCPAKRAMIALADRSPAAAALLAQGERLREAVTLTLENYKLPSYVRRHLQDALNGEEHVHHWVDMRNEVVKSGEMCLGCGAIRAALAPGEETE